MRFSVYQESHIGGRKANQDRMGYCFTRDALLLLLADGMGGHIMGEMAATIAMQTIGNLFQQQATPFLEQPEQFLEESMLAAHKEIHHFKMMNNLPDTPRTTIVACLIQHEKACWAHCGDSRLYWLRNGQLLLRTKDHSRIETLIAQGLVDASQRDTHPDRNKLFNCLGSPILPLIELSSRVRLQAGDVMLLCSDGLWSVLSEQEIIQCLKERTIVRAVPELLNKAISIAGKSSDNATALAMMWEATDDNPSTVITNTLPFDVVATTIHGALSDKTSAGIQEEKILETFDESDIERAIEEIRIAIQKSSKVESKS